MSDAEIRTALRRTNGDVSEAVLLLSEPLAGPKRNVPRPARDGGGVTGTRTGKPERPSDPYRSISRVAEIVDEDALATTELFESFTVDTENLTDKKWVGSGAFGTVYQVTDNVTHKIYALKEFKNSGINNKFLIRELVLLSSVNPARPTRDGEIIFENRNVVGFFGASTAWQRSDGTVGPAILSEFINGKEIGHVRSPEIWTHACRISKELFNGLAFIHGKGVAHGDIKPANIMMERANDGGLYGRVVIVDLGIACFVDYELASRVNPHFGKKYTCDTQSLSGTTEYFSPECVYARFHDHDVPRKMRFSNDVWAATVSLFEVFAGFWYYDTFDDIYAVLPRQVPDGEFSLVASYNFFAKSKQQTELWNIGKRQLRDSAFAKYTEERTGEDVRDVDPQLAEVIEFLAEGASSPDERPTAIEMARWIAVLEKPRKTRKEISAELRKFFPHYYSLLKRAGDGPLVVAELYAQLFPNTEQPEYTESALEAILRFWKAESRLYNPHGLNLQKLKNQATLGEGTFGKVYRVV
jgi:serine/threonine protein kinase